MCKYYAKLRTRNAIEMKVVFCVCFVCKKELKRDYKRLREDTLSLSWQVSCQSCGNTDSVIIIMKINCESKMKKSQLKIELRIVLFFFLCRILIKFNYKRVEVFILYIVICWRFYSQDWSIESKINETNLILAKVTNFLL